MNRLLQILMEILRRLKEVPGLQFLGTYHVNLQIMYGKIQKKKKEFANKKAFVADKLKAASEIPDLVKGSKKKQS